MRRLMLVWVALVAGLLVLFVAVEAAGVPLLSDPDRSLRLVSVPVAVLGVGLLVVDALLPVASSAVMVIHGAAFGVIGGTALSTCGAAGSLALAAWIGRRGRAGWSRPSEMTGRASPSCSGATGRRQSSSAGRSPCSPSRSP